MAVRVSSAEALIAAIHDALRVRDPAAKVAAVAALDASGSAGIGACPAPVWPDPAVPGRPDKPELIRPRDVPTRGLGTVAGRAALIHAVAHIEFNAINLALDAAWRFRGLPDRYYADWLSVARDEARHFAMLRARLQSLGYDYGDLPAHNGLWEAAEKTAHDVLDRMCCVPRVLEARGLDVTPGIIRRLTEIGDADTVAILDVILAEEVGHVRIGSDWYAWLCARRGVDPLSTSRRLLAEQGMNIRPPINETARRAAGFGDEELRLLLLAAG
ncbi:MAG: DUF455 domain-containing protein [Xanthomonadaceae bacterium]|nr:DUF455 domain-containing protein [Xanthomonadaceae bacterium]